VPDRLGVKFPAIINGDITRSISHPTATSGLNRNSGVAGRDPGNSFVYLDRRMSSAMPGAGQLSMPMINEYQQPE